MKFKCSVCKTEVEQFPWPWEYENMTGHFYALCKGCALEKMHDRFSQIKDVAFAKELIKNFFQQLRAKMIENKVENLECADGGFIFVGDALGTVDNGGESVSKPSQES